VEVVNVNSHLCNRTGLLGQECTQLLETAGHLEKRRVCSKNVLLSRDNKQETWRSGRRDETIVILKPEVTRLHRR